MKDGLAIVLGTDNNSYSVARSYYERYGEKMVVCGSAVLVPFKHSKIAKVYTKDGFYQDNDVFVNLLNEVYKKEAKVGDKVIFFVPTEGYLFHLYQNLDKLDFEYVLPYPEQNLAEQVANKSRFYPLMEDIGISVPKTVSVNPENFQTVLSEFDANRKLFLKADDYYVFQTSDVEDPQKGYHAANVQEAQDILNKVYPTYAGLFIVQQYIEGGDASEYSIMGYRATDGSISMVQAHALLSDRRPKWIGNHLVMVDSDREDLFTMATKIVESTDYYGHFNFDFKVDEITEVPYALELNPRLGRSFIYANLGGINFIELAIEDLIHGNVIQKYQEKPFVWLNISRAEALRHLSEEDKTKIDEKERLENTGHSLFYEKDAGFLRMKGLTSYLANWDKGIFPTE